MKLLSDWVNLFQLFLNIKVYGTAGKVVDTSNLIFIKMACILVEEGQAASVGCNNNRLNCTRGFCYLREIGLHWQAYHATPKPFDMVQKGAY